MINMLKSSSKLKPPVQIGLAGFYRFWPFGVHGQLSKRNFARSKFTCAYFSEIWWSGPYRKGLFKAIEFEMIDFFLIFKAM